MKHLARSSIAVMVAAVMTTFLAGCPPQNTPSGPPVEIGGTVDVSYPADGQGAQVFVKLPDAVSGTVTITCDGHQYSTQLITDPGQWRLRGYYVVGVTGPYYLVAVGGWFDVRLGKAADDKSLFGALLLIPYYDAPDFCPYVVFTNVPFGGCCSLEFNGTTHFGKPAHWSDTVCIDNGPWQWECWPPYDDPRIDNGVLRISHLHNSAGNNPDNVWGLVDVFAGEPKYTVDELLIEFEVGGYTGGDDGDYMMPVALDDPDGFSFRGTTPSCAVGTRGTAYCWVHTQYGWHRSEPHPWVITDDGPVIEDQDWRDWVNQWRADHGYNSINWNNHKDVAKE